MPFTTNQTPSSGAKHVYNLATTIVAAGGTIVKYSNGSTVTNGSPGSHTPLENTNAWILVTAPSGRQYVWQRGGGNHSWTISVSVSAAFSGGDGANAPTAADEKVLINRGSNDALATDGTYRGQYYAGSVAPFGWYAFAYPIGGGDVFSAWFEDPITSPIESPASDADPYVYMAGPYNANTFTKGSSSSWSGASYIPKFYLNKGLGGETFISGIAAYLYSPNGHVDTGMNPQTLKTDLYAVNYMRPISFGTIGGFKGVSTLFAWSFVSGFVPPGDGGSLSDAPLAYWAVGGSLFAKWDGTTTPIK